jgi:hypothetical protein
MMQNIFGDRCAETGRAVGKPGRYPPAVERQVRESGTFHRDLILTLTGCWRAIVACFSRDARSCSVFPRTVY